MTPTASLFQGEPAAAARPDDCSEYTVHDRRGDSRTERPLRDDDAAAEVEGSIAGASAAVAQRRPAVRESTPDAWTTAPKTSRGNRGVPQPQEASFRR